MTSRKRSAIAHIDSDFGGECLLHLLQYLAPCKPVQSAASIPARRSTLTSSMTLSFRREANALFSVLPLGLCCSNRRFVCVSQTTLPNGFFTKDYGRPSLFVPQPCRLQTLLVKVQLFILGGGPKGHESLPSYRLTSDVCIRSSVMAAGYCLPPRRPGGGALGSGLISAGNRSNTAFIAITAFACSAIS